MKRFWQRYIDRWIARRHFPSRVAISLHRRRIYILPTRYGYSYALMLLVIFLWSINYSNSMGFALTFLLAAIGENSMRRCHNNLLGLRIHPGQAESVFAGQAAQFQFRIENPDPEPRYGLALQWRDTPPQLVDVPAHGSATVTLAIPSQQRGWLQPGRIEIFTRFPLGMLHAWSWLEFHQAALIYPAPHGQQPLPPAQPAERGSGNREVALGSEDFAGLRRYTVGDSPRRVAWKASARNDDLLVKRFSDQVRPELWLDWQQLSSTSSDDARLAQLCQWVLKADADGRAYGLRLPDAELPPDHGLQHRRRCLEALALFGKPSPA